MRRILLYGFFIFVFSIGTGFYYASLWKKQNMPDAAKLIQENKVKETSITEEKVAFDAELALKKYYNECGHCLVNEVELPAEFINLTKDEVEELYSEWRIEKFSDKEIVLAQNIDSMCDEHYVLRLGESNVEIYQMEEFDDFRLLKTTNISREYLTDTDIVNLEEGIFVYGTRNLNSALEDFE